MGFRASLIVELVEVYFNNLFSSFLASSSLAIHLLPLGPSTVPRMVSPLVSDEWIMNPLDR